MNDLITNNLFELWNYIGNKNNIYIETSNYKVVSAVGSDWPKRVYAIEDKVESYEEIIKKSNESLLPNIITLSKYTDIINRKKFNSFLLKRICL